MWQWTVMANPPWGIGAMVCCLSVCVSLCWCTCCLVQCRRLWERHFIAFSNITELMMLITNTHMQPVMYTKSTYSVFVYTFIKNTGTHLVSRKSAFSPIWCLLGCLSVCQWNCVCVLCASASLSHCITSCSSGILKKGLLWPQDLHLLSSCFSFSSACKTNILGKQAWTGHLEYWENSYWPGQPMARGTRPILKMQEKWEGQSLFWKNPVQFLKLYL